MSRNEGNVVTQRPELRDNGFDESVVIAAREIRSADRSLENHITDGGELRRLVEEDDVSRRVPRAVAHGQCLLTDGDGVMTVEPAIGCEGTGVDAVFFARFLYLINPELIFRMRPFDGKVEAFREFGDAAGMIDMSMGNEDFLQRHAVLFDRAQDVVQIAAGIDHRRLVRFGAPQDGAVLL